MHAARAPHNRQAAATLVAGYPVRAAISAQVLASASGGGYLPSAAPGRYDSREFSAIGRPSCVSTTWAAVSASERMVVNLPPTSEISGTAVPSCFTTAC